ncbi:hypothetical protein [Pantoea rwandensis]|uniref:Uncharacterized protein n=1 Tax=Pantoea rwandensis TaxID=1076550 RepID=A0A1X1CQH1_9GAMM|nr:hypothetical protein [Pantoea rwandensis]ORM66676.1 hypothetical protein HA51_23150 [Pantoea rwandensis]
MKFNYSIHRLNLKAQWQKDSFRVLFFVFTMMLFSVIIKWILPLFSHGNVIGGFSGMISGLLVNFWLTNISELTIKSPIYTDELVTVLNKYKYRQTDHDYYELQVAKLTRFQSQRIYIRNDGNSMILEGPYNTLKKIINQLNK